MADDNTIQVTFQTDVSQLNDAIARVRAQFSQLQGDAKSLSGSMDAFAKSTKDGVKNTLDDLGKSTANVRASVGNLEGDLGKVDNALSGGGAHGSGRLLFEVHALADELLSGRTHQALGTFTNFEFILAGINPQIAIATGAVLAFGAAIGGVAYELVSANNQLKQLDASAAGGQFEASREQAEAMIQDFTVLADVSRSVATKILASFDSLGEGGRQLAVALTPIAEQMAKAKGVDIEKGYEQLLKLFEENSKAAEEFLRSLGGVTLEEIRHYQQLRTTGQAGEANKVIFDALTKVYNGVTASARESQIAQSVMFQGFADLGAAAAGAFPEMLSLADAEKKVADAAENTAKKERDAADASERLANASRVSQQQAAIGAQQTAANVNKNSTEVDRLSGEYDSLTAALGKIDQSTAAGYRQALNLQEAMQLLRDAIRETQERANGGLIPSNAFERAQEQIRQLQASFRGMKSDLVTQELDILGLSKLGNKVPSNSKEGQQFDDEIAKKQRELREAGTEEFITSEKIKTAATANGTAERLALAQREQSAKRATYGVGSTEEREAQLEVTNAARAAAEQRRADQAAQLDQEIADVKKAAQDKLKVYSDDVRTHRLSAQEGAAGAVAALQAESGNLRSLYEEKKNLALTGLQEKRAIDKEEAGSARDIAEQIKEQMRVASDATQKGWQDAARTIETAFNSQLRGLLDGTQSWATAGRHILQDFAVQAIEGFEKMAINFALQQTVMNTAASAGAALRIAADQTASSGGIAAMLANAVKSIVVDAKVTEAGVTASVAPIAGPAAPAIGAAAGASVLGLAAFDVGTWALPNTGAIMAHKGEMIVPAAATPWAQALMANAASSSSGAGGGDSHYWNITSNASDPRDVAREVAALWTRNPSFRPRY